MNKIIKNPLFWVILASILPILSLLHPGMPFLHDAQDHVARIANFYQALKEGILVPRWAGALNWGYGHPILMFLYPLPEYLASAFHWVGFTLVDSTKLVFGLSFVASAITMFLWMSSALGAEAGVFGALLYAFAPYRFVDLHVRGALGEHVAFIFPPLCMYYLQALSRSKTVRNTYVNVGGAAISIGALILSHNAIALMFLPIIGFYALYLLISESKNRWQFTLAGIAALGAGLGLSAFFWIPAVFEGKFTLRDVVTAGEALGRFVPWSGFFYSPWNYGGTNELSKALGFPQWIGIVAAGILLVKTKEKKRNVLIAGSLIIFIVSLFIMTSWSTAIWRASKLLQEFQFPWRFLSVSVFTAAVLGGISLPYLITKLQKRFRVSPHVLRIVLIIVIVGVTFYMWVPKAYQVHDDSYYSGIYPGTTDTGESSPIWSVRFMEHTPDNPLDVIDGDATVIIGKRTTTEHDYTVTVRSPTLMMENTLYFPGWMIYVNGLQTGIEWQNPTYRGLMTFPMTPGADQRVRVVFQDTKVRRIADWLSLATLILGTMTGVGVFLWRKK